MNYVSVDSESNLPTHACITPSKAGESPILVPLLYMPSLGITMEYHRRRYYLNTEENEWTKIRCNTTMPLPFFQTWSGIANTHQMEAAGIRFGENKFDVRQPTFKEMYKAQLLSPFTVFQLFCVVLWMLDDYWQYSAFTLFMILTFEATVVFSRIKSLSALRGMGNRARMVNVFRKGEWGKVWTTDLLPGDILSLTRCVPPKKKESENDGDVVPADILLLRGSTVVNEASLTGESVPQMKEGISELVEGEHLDMKTRHKTHVLYAGTKMLQCKGASDKPAPVSHHHAYGDIPNPPDGGCVCFVLRTGFSSAQGKLVRMIEGSQEKVKGHEKETALLLFLLFFFAMASSSYVLYHGLRDENRSQYELLLHCILIITSVIPPELPMQMALAVNNSLMTLMKLQIFCTEPFRVPIAGKLDACLFDKTGTLTTDELVPVGVFGAKSLGADLAKLSNSSVKKGGKDEADSQLLTPMTKLSHEAALVLTGCHSLVLIDGETTGDPLESAALKAMRWEKEKGTPFTFPNTSPSSEIEILSRHHFSSKLQRMSCVVKDLSNRKYYAVVKGSPEMIGKHLSQKPKGYDETAKYLSRRGYRVIALAYKPLSSTADVDVAKDTRSVCEENLIFAGFVSFTCRVRRDTKLVLRKLKEGGMSVAMVTGDALLTAIHVAKERHNSTKPILILEQDDNGTMYWLRYDDDTRGSRYVANEVPKLAKSYDLAVTGNNLETAYEYDVATKTILEHFKVFARMTPDAKETVIECLHSVGKLCLMCGDGANDVGALKQADVGVALLSGFGDVNVDKGEDGNKKKGLAESALVDVSSNITVISRQDFEAAKAGPVWALKLKINALATIAGQLENLEVDELPMVKIGDASVAAPFTSKIPSIRSCVDIVRQGRCTLVTSIQMYQILALNCLISAYSLSVLYLDGVKYGDVQMTAMGMLGSVSYMSVSRAKPLDKLSSVKPLTSIFHPSLFVSLLGQFGVHLATMMWAVRTAKQHLEDDHKVDLDGEFKPGILNSVVFLVSNVQQVTVFVVNLQGRPFMTGLTENRPLLWSLLATFMLTFMFASESVPGLNKYFQLVPFPSEEFRDFIIKILIGDVTICFLFDRAMKLLFCPQILKASVEGTTMKDVMGLARTVLVIGFLMHTFLGDSDQWDEMLEQERLAALNDTNATEDLKTAMKDAVKACVGSECVDDVQMHDEF
ncbi:predicted protein [Thalassiosira pseudonana CCMP1335]|uniref:P-type ATPase A domain-containing protein n=1 Tax=Thalassiosira pseudonana TaxID=35128 RepID=B5YNZ0_THAPS|nr:predicted protein [Thalassiosira pseudonana CCMP1335]ACI64716.1 predicted protein [Thalassiosira pseudonana CCMP1335]